jgi:hypothetical protein
LHPLALPLDSPCISFDFLPRSKELGFILRYAGNFSKFTPLPGGEGGEDVFIQQQHHVPQVLVGQSQILQILNPKIYQKIYFVCLQYKILITLQKLNDFGISP